MPGPGGDDPLHGNPRVGGVDLVDRLAQLGYRCSLDPVAGQPSEERDAQFPPRWRQRQRGHGLPPRGLASCEAGVISEVVQRSGEVGQVGGRVGLGHRPVVLDGLGDAGQRAGPVPGVGLLDGQAAISRALDEVISRRRLFDRRKARSTVVVVGSASDGQSVLLSHRARSMSWISW